LSFELLLKDGQRTVISLLLSLAPDCLPSLTLVFYIHIGQVSGVYAWEIRLSLRIDWGKAAFP
jgi:hypothetical protein